MALPSSGAISLGDREGDSRSIMFEIRGNYTGAFSLRTANSESGKAATAKLKDYYGYQHVGDMWGFRSGFFADGAQVTGDTIPRTGAIPTTEAIVYTAGDNEKTLCENGSGQAFKTFESIDATLFRATKDSTSWSSIETWSPYLSELSAAIHDFSVYSYKWQLIV